MAPRPQHSAWQCSEAVLHSEEQRKNNVFWTSQQFLCREAGFPSGGMREPLDEGWEEDLPAETCIPDPGPGPHARLLGILVGFPYMYSRVASILPSILSRPWFPILWFSQGAEYVISCKPGFLWQRELPMARAWRVIIHVSSDRREAKKCSWS